MKEKKIGIVGYGYVGKAYEEFFKGHYEISIYDPAYPNLQTKEEINQCDLAVICVPTAMKEDGTADTSIAEESVKWLETSLILIKSTIPPGTTDRLKQKTGKRIVFSPEYVGEGKYTMPFWKYPHATEIKWHDFLIVGGDRTDTNEVIDICQKILGPDCHYHQTDAKTAEAVKYGDNSWGAMKVTFFNEWYDICEALGIDFKEWRELLLLDKRIERIHTAVFPDSRGFGGKCFPKDVSAIISASKAKGYNPKLLQQMMIINEEFRKLNE